MQKTCPRIVSSHLCQIGRVVSNDFMDRNISSTVQSRLYVRATSLAGMAVLVRRTHVPSYRASFSIWSSSMEKAFPFVFRYRRYLCLARI
jgi:hypothetical protein